jgi:GT2 family glycosyltransferase
MSRLSRSKERLREALPLSWKLALKRLGFGLVRSVVRLAAGGRKAAERVLLSATTHGLDIHRAWEVNNAPRPPFALSFGAHDFLFLMNAASGLKTAGPSPDRPVRTSIIIPVHNKAEFTFQALRALMREIDFGDTEIIIVNNASTDETKQVLAYLGDLIRVINNQANLGFVDACNQGAAAARGRYLVFLNNDTIILPDWLEHLLTTIEGDDTVGAVGSMLLYPDWRIQEAGAIVWRDGAAFHYGWGKSPEDRRFNFAREVDYCSGASLLVRKDLFDRLGGFDRRYSPAYYEDTDLCFGVRALGYKVVYQPASRLIHYEGATAGTDTSGGFKQYQVVNRQKFFDKWRDTLLHEQYPNDPRPAEFAANRKSGPYIFVFDDMIPAPDRDAGSARMFFILKSLAAWSKPVFVAVGKTKRPEYERMLWKEGIETVSVLEYPRLLKKRKVQAAILSRPFVAEAVLASIRRASPDTKIIYDMVDAHFIRLRREHELTGRGETAREAARYHKMETRLARASDVVWCASTEDKRVVERLAPGKSIAVVPTIHAPCDRGRSFEERKHLLFIGNMRHRPNADGLQNYLDEIHPLVRNALQGVMLHVIGEGATAELEAYAGDDVLFHGHVRDAGAMFRECRVMVAPLRFGAGAKGKVGEALAHGLPVVTTPIGAEGMGFADGQELLIADTAAEFAEAVARVYNDRELWQQLSEAGYSFVQTHLTPAVVGKIINDSVKQTSERS